MPLSKKPKLAPWDYEVVDSKYQEEPWILKKGKDYITMRKNTNNRDHFYLQKNEEKVLSLASLQARLTYHQLIEFGYKLQKPKRKK